MTADWAERVLTGYGQVVTLCRGGVEEETRAFLQPVAEKGETAARATAIGTVDERLWLYLGRTALEAGDLVCWRGLRFWVRSCRPYYVGEELSHYWAALEQAKEAAE